MFASSFEEEDIESYNCVKEEEEVVESYDCGGVAIISTKITFQYFLDELFQESIEENDREILKCAMDSDRDLRTRIETFIDTKMPKAGRKTCTADSVLKDIPENPVIRAFFCKDPIRQTFHEKVQMAWLKKHQYSDLAKSTGICFSNSKLYAINKTGGLPRPSDATKTFDAYVPSKKMYIILKYTSGPGGSQDNQFADVKHFCLEAVKYLSANPVGDESFAFYLDGTYYTHKKFKVLHDMIPIVLQTRILITNCAAIIAT